MRARSELDILEVQNVSKRYGAIQALDGVSFHLAEREWVGLIGPNGAGKTTLFQALCGLVRNDAGRIAIAGREITLHRRDDTRALVGHVPQEIALYPLLTVGENLEVFGEMHGVRKAELTERIVWALAWTGLAERRHSRVESLSGGMQRQLNIACGVLHRPRLVLLDEPTVGVDPAGRRRIWAMLDALRNDGATLVQSSHQLDEIQFVCDRMLILDRGRIVAGGTLDELVAGVERIRFDPPWARNAASRNADGPDLEDVFTHVTGRSLYE